MRLLGLLLGRVSIHRTDCDNIHLSEEERQRLIEAEWYVEDNKDLLSNRIK